MKNDFPFRKVSQLKDYIQIWTNMEIITPFVQCS